ncbi:MAG: DMT family protein [Bacteroidales bacterium]|nr:DMT family protein [Bacteroidales bacterium]
MTGALLTVLLLIISNIFMTFAWYGNLKLQEMNISTSWPLILIILASWGLAFFEYCFMIPANRVGSQINGGPFSLMQLKVIQEAVSLTVFTVIVSTVFKGEPIKWNHFVAFALIILAVFFAFLNTGPKNETTNDDSEIRNEKVVENGEEGNFLN